MNSKEKLIVELSRALLARASHEAGKRAKMAKPFTRERSIKKRQAERFKKKADDMKHDIDVMRRDGLDRQLKKNREMPTLQGSNKKALDKEAFKKYNQAKERSDRKHAAMFRKGAVMRGIKRVIRRFSSAEKARQKKRYDMASKLTPKRDAVRQDYEENPRQFPKSTYPKEQQ